MKSYLGFGFFIFVIILEILVSKEMVNFTRYRAQFLYIFLCILEELEKFFYDYYKCKD